ncbi:MAG: hypothetical protein R2725_12210 [Solirubrobacterales bacterium]
MDRDEIAMQLRDSLEEVEPRPLSHEVIVARVGRRRRRRRIGAAGAAVGLLAIAVITVAIVGGPSEGPLGPPTVEASARVALPGEVVGAGGEIVGTAAVEGDYLWVLTCSARCGGPPAEFEHSQGALVKVDSGTGEIVASTPIEGASILATGEGGVWTAGYDGTVTHFDPRTAKPIGSLHLSLPKPVGTNYPEAFAFLPNNIVAGEGAVWVSTAREYVAQIDPQATTVIRTIPTHFSVAGMAVGGGSVWLAAELFGLARLDPKTGKLGPPHPIDGTEGRRLSMDYLAIADGSLWARGGWATPHGDSYVVSPDGDAHGLARIEMASGNEEQLVSFDGHIWVHAVSDGRLWLQGSDSRAGSKGVYVLEPGASEIRLAARLAEPGTVIGAVGSSLWVATPGKVLERYEIPD